MKALRHISRFLLFAALVLCSLHGDAVLWQKAGSLPAYAASGASAPHTSANRPLLPAAFAGVPRQGDVVVLPAPGDVDAAHAAVLKEAGLVSTDRALYAGTGSAGWTVEALHFRDATGAYSAFTFYRQPGIRAEHLGDNSAASADLFLVRSSATLVMVHPTPSNGNAAQDVRHLGPAIGELVKSLPRVQGPEAVMPSLPSLLPRQGLQEDTIHYAIGPAAYNGPLPATAMNFSNDAEVVTANYPLGSGVHGTLTLIMLPTPQIALAALKTIEALPQPALHAATKRSGPLVEVVSGAGVSAAAAKKLLARIHFGATVTLDQPQGYTSEVAKAAKLLLGIGMLTAMLALAALVIGVFLGGGRILIRRLRGKPDSSMHDDEFISLKL